MENRLEHSEFCNCTYYECCICREQKEKMVTNIRETKGVVSGPFEIKMTGQSFNPGMSLN